MPLLSNVREDKQDEQQARYEKLMADLVAKGMIAPDDAPPTKQASVTLNPASVLERQPPQAAPAPPRPSQPREEGKTRGRARKESLRELRDVVLGSTERRLTNAAKAAHEAHSGVGRLMWYFDTPEGRAALAAMSPKEQEAIKRKARMAAQDAMAIERARERNVGLHEIRSKKLEGIEKTLGPRKDTHELAKSQRDIIEENLLRKGYDKEFARKHSKTVDANCPTCEHDGIKSPLTRDFEGIGYHCSNPDCGGTFTPVDPTAKKVSWKVSRKAHEGSKSDVKEGKGLEAGSLRPRLLKPVKES